MRMEDRNDKRIQYSKIVSKENLPNRRLWRLNLRIPLLSIYHENYFHKSNSILMRISTKRENDQLSCLDHSQRILIIKTVMYSCLYYLTYEKGNSLVGVNPWNYWINNDGLLFSYWFTKHLTNVFLGDHWVYFVWELQWIIPVDHELFDSWD